MIGISLSGAAMRTLPLILLTLGLTLAADEHPAAAPKAKTTAKTAAKVASAPPAHAAAPTEAAAPVAA